MEGQKELNEVLLALKDALTLLAEQQTIIADNLIIILKSMSNKDLKLAYDDKIDELLEEYKNSDGNNKERIVSRLRALGYDFDDDDSHSQEEIYWERESMRASGLTIEE